MTAYSVPFVWSYSVGTNVYTFCPLLAIKANAFAVRIVAAEWYGSMYNANSGTNVTTTGAIFGTVYRYNASTISGGAGTIIPAPLRNESDPASATVRYQTSAYNGTTPSYTPGTAVTVTGTPQLVKRKSFAAVPDENSWTPVSDTTIQPGSVFTFKPEPPATGSNGYFAYLLITIDEEHTARSG